MATGTAPALDPNVTPKTEAAQSAESHPTTFRQRFVALLHQIFEREDESTHWHQ